MRIPRWGFCLLGVGLGGFVGCSQTGLLRPHVPADVKTVAAVGGRPVSTVAGEPGTGSSSREDIDDLGPPPSAGSRISGRVFDEQGRAVPNARVRLGVGGTSGGRVNFATTDRSGAFTLHGLRPGRDYTVIAEYQAEDGMMSGRVQAHAPETGVRIALGARDPEAEPPGSKNLTARVRSSLFPENENDGFPGTTRSHVRDDAQYLADREPPADDPAPASAPAPGPHGSRPKRPIGTKMASASQPKTGAIRAGWTVRETPSEVATLRSRRSDAEAETEEPVNAPPAPEALDDEGDNPLPPALEPEDAAPRRTSSRTGFTPAGPDEVRVASNARKPRARRPAAVIDESEPTADRDQLAEGVAPRPIPEDAFPTTRDVARADHAGSGRRPSADAAEAPARRAAGSRRNPRSPSSASSQSGETARPRGSDAVEEGDGATDNPSPRPRSNRRPTWRELSISSDDVPVDEALRRSSVDEDEVDDRDAVIRAVGPKPRREAEQPEVDPSANEPGPARARKESAAPDDEQPRAARTRATSAASVDDPRSAKARAASPAIADEPQPARRRRITPIAPIGSKGRTAPTPAATNPADTACRLDSGNRRVVELRLPGVDGVPVSLADFDADLILLDFWGSWCRECVASIDHHRDLQERLGGKRLQVVGIACEKGATFEARRDAAAAAARKLGINYPVLVTSKDGNCPAQRALQVQFYPSMVLLDREGNILQFERGATDATLGRIDRAIAKALREGDR